MKKVLICAKKSKTDSYVGGVITILDQYFSHDILFQKYDIDLSWFDYHMPFDLPNQKLNNVFYGIKQTIALKRKLKSERYDIVNIHTSMQFLFLKDVILSKVISKYTKVIITVHVGSASTVFERITGFEKMCINILNKNVCKIIFLSNSIKSEFISLGLDEKKATVLYNFHDLCKVEKMKEMTQKKVNLLFVGAIHKEKGIVELMHAINELDEKSYHLDICGKVTDKSISEEFNNFLSEHKNSVTMHGYIQGDEKSRIYNTADVLVLPSYHEGMPLVILEAMASRCAIITTPVGAIPEILDESNAIFVKKCDVESLKKAIELIINDSSKREELKNNNTLKSRDYSCEQHIGKLCMIYDEVV